MGRRISDDKVEQVKGGGAGPSSPPPRSDRRPKTTGIVRKTPPKKPIRKAKDSAPLKTFRTKVGQAKGKNPTPKKK